MRLRVETRRCRFCKADYACALYDPFLIAANLAYEYSKCTTRTMYRATRVLGILLTEPTKNPIHEFIDCARTSMSINSYLFSQNTSNRVELANLDNNTIYLIASRPSHPKQKLGFQVQKRLL